MSTTTASGDRVDPTNRLCDWCHRRVATIALYWTDDAEFKGDDYYTPQRRFAMLQERLTDVQTECQTNCGRVVGSDR